MASPTSVASRTRAAIQAGQRHIVIDFIDDEEHCPLWAVWLSHDPQCRFGTYLLLFGDGRIERVTENPDGVDSVLIAPSVFGP